MKSSYDGKRRKMRCQAMTIDVSSAKNSFQPSSASKNMIQKRPSAQNVPGKTLNNASLLSWLKPHERVSFFL
jgi:hypothetical protein